MDVKKKALKVQADDADYKTRVRNLKTKSINLKDAAVKAGVGYQKMLEQVVAPVHAQLERDTTKDGEGESG